MFKRGIHIVYAIGVVSAAPLYAVPVVPNFTQGSMTSTTGLDLNSADKPNWRQTQAGNSFSFTEHYSGPGLQTHTIIQRETTVQSVTESTSIFSN